MFELSVTDEFCAAHAIEIAQAREPMHGHNWKVSLTVEAAALDADGLVCDFHALERALHAAIDPFRNGSLNETPPFSDVNPTAELVAKHIGETVGRAVEADFAPRVRIARVAVTEAPGCVARWRAPGRGDSRHA